MENEIRRMISELRRLETREEIARDQHATTSPAYAAAQKRVDIVRDAIDAVINLEDLT